MYTLRVMAGDDGAINTKQYVVPYIQAMMLCKGVNSDGSGKLVVPFMMLQVTPIEYDKCGNVVKQYPISTVRSWATRAGALGRTSSSSLCDRMPRNAVQHLEPTVR